MRIDLRRLLTKNKDELFLCDYNPAYSPEERAAIKRATKDAERQNAPRISGADVFAMLSSK